MTHDRDTQQASSYDRWHNQMIRAGWVSVQGLYGNVVQYQYPRRGGKHIVIKSAEFAPWVELEQTPPPF